MKKSLTSLTSPPADNNPPDKRWKFLLEVEDISHEGTACSPTFNRLRIVLKNLLRAHGFRCNDIREKPSDT